MCSKKKVYLQKRLGVLLSLWNDCTRTDLDGLVGVSDESDEEAEHHVDEEGDEGVEVEPAEEPHHVAPVSHLQEGGVHVVPIDEGEEALRHLVESSELEEKRFDDEVNEVKGDLLGHADTWHRTIIIFCVLCHDEAQGRSSRRNSSRGRSSRRSSRIGSHSGTPPSGLRLISGKE